MTEYRTHAYKVRSAREAARVLDIYRVRGPRRIAALRSFHRTDHATVAVPTGRVVLNRK